MLHTLYLGSSISATNLARHIVRNTSLINIHIENHDLLYSNNGVLYDSSRKILLKYPEGRNYFTIMDNVNTIGEYSVAQCTNFKGTLTIPDHIELIEAEGFFACQYITNIIFNNTSKLHTISDRAFQLSSALRNITLPASLRVIGNLAFASCKVLEELKFLGTTAPSITATSFGSEFSNWCGVDAKTRIVYIPASSSGYDGI